MSTTPAAKTLNKIDFLRLMMLSREGDRREGILLRQSKGWFQVGGLGHEALAAFAYVMREDDWVFPYYRSRALMLARGMTNYEMALAYFAKRKSSSGGRISGSTRARQPRPSRARPRPPSASRRNDRR